MSLLQLRSSAPTLQRLFTSIKNGLMPESDAEHGALLDDPMHPERHLPTPATHLNRTPLKAGEVVRSAPFGSKRVYCEALLVQLLKTFFSRLQVKRVVG